MGQSVTDSSTRAFSPLKDGTVFRAIPAENSTRQAEIDADARPVSGHESSHHTSHPTSHPTGHQTGHQTGHNPNTVAAVLPGIVPDSSIDVSPDTSIVILPRIDIAPSTGGGTGDSSGAVAETTLFDPLTPTIFHEPWWLDTATQGNYGVAEVAHGGIIVGRMPYHIVRRAGISYNMPPTLTHFLGPAIIPLEGNPNSQFLRRLKITDELIKRLPAVSLHKIRCHRGVQDVVAFQANCFVGGVQFTGEIAPANPALIWKNMRDKTRNVIRRAMDSFTVVDNIDEEEFMRFYECNLESGMVYDSAICRRLIQNCLQRGVGKIFCAKSTNGQLAAAIFCAWDRTSMYYLMSTRNAAAGNGAVSLLIWDAIQHAVRANLTFDFDGFYNNGSILFCSGFGPVVQPRYQLEKATIIARFAMGVRSCFRERTYLW